MALGIFAALFLLSLIVLVAVIPQFMIAACNKLELLAIPFFILAAKLMSSSGMTERSSASPPCR